MHETLFDVEAQKSLELRYNRKFIDQRVRAEFTQEPEFVEKINEGVELVKAYLSEDYSYASKNERLAQLEGIDLYNLVLEVFVATAYCVNPSLLTSVAAQLSSRLGMSDKPSALTTAAELLAVLCETDMFNITKAAVGDSLMVQSCVELSEDTINFSNNSQFLPPMVCKPLELTDNYSSGYLMHKDSLILKSGNHHEGDICLDVLNKVNSVKLSLDTDFLSSVEEDGSEITVENMHKNAHKKGKCITEAQALEAVVQAKDNWTDFKQQSYAFYTLMVDHGNQFYLTHRVDKRGRLYCSGYHISTQGSSFKKASINLAKTEVVTGVPAHLQIK